MSKRQKLSMPSHHSSTRNEEPVKFCDLFYFEDCLVNPENSRLFTRWAEEILARCPSKKSGKIAKPIRRIIDDLHNDRLNNIYNAFDQAMSVLLKHSIALKEPLLWLTKLNEECNLLKPYVDFRSPTEEFFWLPHQLPLA